MAPRAARLPPRERLSVALSSPWMRPHRMIGARLGLCAVPGFLILGTQRGGTTSLYSYLVRHPLIRSASRKEVQFFSLNYERGWHWYLAHFPMRMPGAPQGFVTGEASPYYLFHPDVPARVAAHLPHARMIVLLRNPIERAFSHWRHERRHGTETRSFEEAIDACAELAQGADARVPASVPPDAFAFRHFSYLSRGLHADQIERWLRVVPRERLTVLRSEDLYARPGETAGRVVEALGLPPASLGPFGRHNETAAASMNPATRERLRAFFAPHVQRLASLIDLRVDDWT